MKISFLQAGNGDCVLLQGGGHNVIIDREKDSVEYHMLYLAKK